jgi:hypothetical protein
MYISEWDLHGATCGYYQACATREKYTPRDMAFLHVYQNGIWCRHYYQQLVPQGEIYTQDIPSIYQNGIYTVLRLVPSSLCHKGEIYTQGHGIPCIYQNGIHTAPLQYYQQPATRENIYHHLHVYISEWITRCCHLAGSLAACATRRQHTPRDMAFLHVYQNGIYTAPLLLACATREKYTPRDMAFLHVLLSGTGIHPCQALLKQLVPSGEIYTQGHGIPPCIY